MKRELGLSEVIGFLMIVALLGILFSMYLLYVVPIQGRDAEISHMKYITQEFIGLKADIDGLIINNKINLPIARSFELGTLSSVGTGALSIMPMSSYIEASGTLMVNEQNDFLGVTINGDMANIEDLLPPSFSTSTSLSATELQKSLVQIQCYNYTQCPSVPINYTISDRFFNLTTKKRIIMNNLSATINLTDIEFTITPTPDTGAGQYFPDSFEKINATATINITNPIEVYDLVMEIWDNRTFLEPGGRTWLSEQTLIENLSVDENYGTNFTLDIFADNILIPNNSTGYYLTQQFEENLQNLYANNHVSTKVGMFPPRIGSLQYESSNRYWVNQDLLFEMGGLFLSQPSDQGSSVMLVPSIALTPVQNVSDPDDYLLKVSINNIRITDTEDISGSVSAQIFAKIDNINHNLVNATTDIDSGFSNPVGEPIAYWKVRQADVPNAHAVWLQFIPDDPRAVNSTTWDPSITLTDEDKERMKKSTELWKRAFDQVKTLTNKTIAENYENPAVSQYAGWIHNFRTENPANIPPYSANMVIGNNAIQELKTTGHCDPVSSGVNASLCINDVGSYMQNPGSEPFILDYTESEVSLVMQSGAL